MSISPQNFPPGLGLLQYQPSPLSCKHTQNFTKQTTAEPLLELTSPNGFHNLR